MLAGGCLAPFCVLKAKGFFQRATAKLFGCAGNRHINRYLIGHPNLATGGGLRLLDSFALGGNKQFSNGFLFRQPLDQSLVCSNGSVSRRQAFGPALFYGLGTFVFAWRFKFRFVITSLFFRSFDQFYAVQIRYDQNGQSKEFYQRLELVPKGPSNL